MTGPHYPKHGTCTSTLCGIEEDCPLSATVKAPKPLSSQRAAPLPSRKLSLNSASATSTRATPAFISETTWNLEHQSHRPPGKSGRHKAVAHGFSRNAPYFDA
jgi:hypothetical protein